MNSSESNINDDLEYNQIHKQISQLNDIPKVVHRPKSQSPKNGQIPNLILEEENSDISSQKNIYKNQYNNDFHHQNNNSLNPLSRSEKQLFIRNSQINCINEQINVILPVADIPRISINNIHQQKSNEHLPTSKIFKNQEKTYKTDSLIKKFVKLIKEHINSQKQATIQQQYLIQDLGADKISMNLPRQKRSVFTKKCDTNSNMSIANNIRLKQIIKVLILNFICINLLGCFRYILLGAQKNDYQETSLSQKYIQVSHIDQVFDKFFSVQQQRRLYK